LAQKRKVCVVVTARPSYSRIKTALEAIKAHPDLELLLVVAGSALLDRYGSAIKYIQADGFEITERVYMVLEGEKLTTMAKTTGLGLIELATVFDNISPDVVITIADRYETIATAIAASYMNIPLAHVQGGEVTGSIDEKVRHAITKLANIHFVSSKKAYERVLRLGEDPDYVFLTGCPSIDLAAEVLKHPTLAFDPYEKYGGVGAFPDLSKGYMIVMQHPVTTEHDVARSHIVETLHAVRDSGIPALWFWPNVDAGSDGTSTGIRVFREHENSSNLHFYKNMEPMDFLYVLFNSKGIVGNSSTGIRECAFLGVPAVNIGSRQAGRERGKNVLDVGYDRKEILNAINTHFSNGKTPGENIYGDGKAGARIADILAEVNLVSEKKLTY
jgi:UDP-hydrolysing UDP-N-acetyl-D-glucosamine 2-epimerase